MAKKTLEEVFINKYGFNKGNYKYVPAGSEILKFIDQIVILVTFNKKAAEVVKEEEKTEEFNWESTYERAKIISIDDFDPMTMTYNCKYKLENSEEELAVRIIPEGFSWGNPEETGKMLRFMPYSLHCQLVEEELFFERVKELYKTRETMDIEFLKNLSISKTKDQTLKYANNVGAAVKLNNSEDYLWIRFHDVSLRHLNGTNYALKFSNNERSWSVKITSDQKEYDFEGVGTFKIIDLAG